jgi:glycosyltransferase involved in cell wall biosynthesis
MRIVVLTSKLNFQTSGGSVEEVDLIARTLQQMGHEIIMVTVFSYMNVITEPLPYLVKKENVRAKNLLGIQWGVYRLLRTYGSQADFFLIDGHLAIYGAGLYRRLGGQVPVAAHFNRELGCWPLDMSSFFLGTEESLKNKIKRGIRWLIEKSIGMFLANGLDIRSFISPHYQRAYEEFGLKQRGFNFVLGDPLDFAKIKREGRVVEHTYEKRNKTSGPITIFYSSRMAPGKGFDVLLKGFSLVKNKEKFRVVLGGDGPEKPLVEKMIKDLKLEPFVKLTGWVTKEKLYELFSQADIFIQADWRPIGTSMSLLYAMAFGVPSLLPGGGGLQWQAGKSALCFRYRDPEDLARKIEQLGKDYDLRAELSRQCYIRLADEEMDYQKNIGRLEEKMRQIAKQ